MVTFLHECTDGECFSVNGSIEADQMQLLQGDRSKHALLRPWQPWPRNDTRSPAPSSAAVAPHLILTLALKISDQPFTQTILLPTFTELPRILLILTHNLRLQLFP